jgi:hypothetical protein
VAHSGAQKVFGVSVSALITLQAARTALAIRQVAVYEPALLMDTSGSYTSWVHRFDQEMAHGQAVSVRSPAVIRTSPAPSSSVTEIGSASRNLAWLSPHHG